MCKRALDEAIDWFYTHRKVDFDTGCWTLDTALIGPKGSEQYRIPRYLVRSLGFSTPTNSHSFRSRRFAAILFKGFDGNSKTTVYTTCGNPKCCNYEHLSIGRYSAAALKLCSKCNRPQPVRDGFYLCNGQPLSYCKECFRAYVRDWNRKATSRRQTLQRRLDRRSLQRREFGSARRAGVRAGTVSLPRIMQRDQGQCHICLRCITDLEGDLEFDHVTPLSRGGLHQESNVKLAHARCNQWKGVAFMEELHMLGLDQVRQTGKVPVGIAYSNRDYIEECIRKALFLDIL